MQAKLILHEMNERDITITKQDLNEAIADAFDISTNSVECEMNESKKAAEINRAKRSGKEDIVVCTCDIDDKNYLNEIENMVNSTIIPEMKSLLNNSQILMIDAVQIKRTEERFTKNTAGKIVFYFLIFLSLSKMLMIFCLTLSIYAL